MKPSSSSPTCSFLFRLSILVFAVFLATSQFSPTKAFGASAALSWSAPTTYTDGTQLTNLSGYKVYVGTSSGSYSQNIDVGNTTSYTVSSLSDGTKYYFAVMAYDASGFSSGLSNEISYTTSGTTSALYTITTSAGSGGSISPSGSVVVSKGTNQSFTITPNTGYKIADVKVDGASVGTVASYTLSNVTADHTIAATFTTATTAGKVAFATNCGGPQFTDSTGTLHQADTKYSGGGTNSTTTAISGTVDDKLYQSWRYGSNFSYNIPVANGNYSVTLRFADYESAAGKRIFDVKMEGVEVISNLDIYAKVGKYAAYNVTIPVSVSDGVLNINFIGNTGYAKVNSIMVKTR